MLMGKKANLKEISGINPAVMYSHKLPANGFDAFFCNPKTNSGSVQVLIHIFP